MPTTFNQANIAFNSATYTFVEFSVAYELSLVIGGKYKRKELYDGRDLNATIDARSVYASAMSTVFDVDFKRIEKEVFWGENLLDLSDKLFKT